MTGQRFSELYSSPEAINNALRWREFWSDRFVLDEILAPLDRAQATTGLIPYLNSLESRSDRRVQGAAVAIGSLPVQQVIDNCGTDAVVWAAANTNLDARADKLIDELAEQGYQKDFLRKAILLNTDRHRLIDSQLVVDDYRVMADTPDAIEASVDLPRALHMAALDDVDLTEKRISAYTLEPLATVESRHYTNGSAERWNGRVLEDAVCYDIYMDMPTGFVILYKGRPQAVASFRSWQGDELLLGQIQGIKGQKINQELYKGTGKIERTGETTSSRGLMPFKWRELVTGVSEQIAASLGKTRVGVYSESASLWVQGERARALYDVQAEKMGFVQGKDRHWHKELSKPVSSPCISL